MRNKAQSHERTWQHWHKVEDLGNSQALYPFLPDTPPSHIQNIDGQSFETLTFTLETAHNPHQEWAMGSALVSTLPISRHLPGCSYSWSPSGRQPCIVVFSSWYQKVFHVINIHLCANTKCEVPINYFYWLYYWIFMGRTEGQSLGLACQGGAGESKGWGGPMDCGRSGSSVLGISQSRILEWFAISFSRGSSRPRDQTWVSCRWMPSHLSHNTTNCLVKIQRKELVFY